MAKTTAADVTRYRVTGSVEDTGTMPTALGEEVILVVRCTVTKVADRLDDGAVVCDTTLKVNTCAPMPDLHYDRLPAAVRRVLETAAEDAGRLPL